MRNLKRVVQILINLSAILGLIVAAREIWKFAFANPEYKGIGTADYCVYELSPDDNKKINYYDSIQSNSGSEPHKTKNNKNVSKEQSSKDTGLINLPFTVEEHNDILKNKTASVNSVWIFVLENEGEKTLEEITLKVPFSGNAKIISEGKVVNYLPFQRKIDLGNLKPSERVEIRCWVNDFSSTLFKYDDCKFINKSYPIEIYFPDSPNGFVSFNSQYYYMPLLIILILSIAILYLTGKFLYKMGYSKGANSHNLTHRTGD